MKHLRKFNENESQFDIEFAITKIMEKFSESEVCQMFDEELLEWTDSDWSDEYESEYDWYVDHNNGEAQDVIIGQLVDWYNSEYKLSSDDRSELIDRVKQEYNALNYF